MHVLGIDAGATKTVCLLADDFGTVVGEGRGPGANLHVAGELEVEKVLHGVMEEAFSRVAKRCRRKSGGDCHQETILAFVEFVGV